VVVDAQPKKSLGQHWLHDESVLDDIRSSAGIVDGDTVLEIGPGLGTLTARLLDIGAEVTALEFDHDLANSLRENTTKLVNNTSNMDHLSVLEGDIRGFNFTTLSSPYKLCANIPYYLTSHLLRQLCDTNNKPEKVALLIQKEVAERVAAEDGKMSIISCFVHFYYDCFEGSVVPARLFTPAPKVDSQVLIMHRRNTRLFNIDEKKFFRIIKAGFAGKRKNLRNTLSSGLGLEKDTIVMMLERAVIDPQRRAETLSLYEWKNIYDSLDMLSSK
jgi:16S rRNA (adenine1518-N6/adenine1519-N6)-dimethyltransferase